MTEEKLLTVAEAYALLHRSFDRQRPLNQNYVFLWAEEMRRGEFRAQSQIRIAICNGTQYLVDGQHRLNAQVEANVPMVYTITYTECSDEEEIGRLYSVIDRGQPRTVPQLLNAQDIDVARSFGFGPGLLTVMNAASVWIESGFATTSGQISYLSRSEDQIVRRVKEWSPAFASYHAALSGKSLSSHAGKKAKHVGMVASALLQYRYCVQNADEFWVPLAEDDGLRLGDPRKTLLRTMEEERAYTITKERWFFASIAAWNAWVEGRELRHVQKVKRLPPRIAGLVDCPFWR